MDDQQNGEKGQEPNSLATAAALKEKRARSDTTLASFMGKNKPKDEVYWDDDSGKPKSRNSTQYSDVIGVLLKQSRRFKWHKHWDKQDDEAKDWLWAELMDLFTLDDCRKKDTLSIAGGIFRNKKSTWKSGKYKKSNTLAQNLAGRPNALTEGEWNELVKHWDGAEHQKLSAKNIISRSKQKTKHTMGRKNYARCKAEL
ncbi:hypothetical protein MKW94_000787, partial [Papaver nudicaule]|nr:hypothetical protein [Papaver nudicaule]